MYCKNCGNELGDNGEYCSVCGNKINLESKDGSEKTKGRRLKKSRFGFLLASIALIIVGGLFLGGFIGDDFSEFEAEATKYEEKINGYILGDKEQRYNELLSEKDQIIVQKNDERIESFLKELSNFEKEVAESNLSELQEDLDFSKNIDKTRATEEEKAKVDEYIENIEESMEDKLYKSAKEDLDSLRDYSLVFTTIHDNLDISVEQVDTSEYPNIKMYVSIEDRDTGESLNDIEEKFFMVSEGLSQDDIVKREIQRVAQLNEKESLKLNMVSDVSGSMDGEPMITAQNVMNGFLDSVQFEVGDKVELTSFSDGVYINREFTDDRQALKNEINNLYTGDMTSLYDALYAAVQKTAVEGGAKCVIAFTDGQDNNSYSTPEEVVNIANRYNIPVFIIGIGDNLSSSILSDIADRTGGFYSNVSDIGDMQQIYESIYRNRKEMYAIEYDTLSPDDKYSIRDIELSVQTRENGGICEFSYEPHVLMSAELEYDNMTGVEGAVGNYLNGFVSAINSNNYSYLEDYVVEGGPLYQEVRPFIEKDIQERLLSYEILSKDYIDDNTCLVKLHETYEIQNNKEPLHMRLLEARYILKKQSNGSWKFYEFDGKIKILSKIKS